jgi:peptidyl-prolyl cis-trans isomerase-like 4
LFGEQARYFEDEIRPDAKYNSIGLVGSSNNGPNKNQSGFFITLTGRHLQHLDGKHTIFGKVVEGLEVLEKLNETHTDEKNRPLLNIRILHTNVLDDPIEDPPQLRLPSHSPERIREKGRLEYDEKDEFLNNKVKNFFFNYQC